MSFCLVLFVLTCIENLQQKEEFLTDGTNVSFTFAFLFGLFILAIVVLCIQ